MNDETFRARISEPQFAPYKIKYQELETVLDMCKQNIIAAQDKIGEQTAELTILRGTAASTAQSLKEAATKMANIKATIEDGSLRIVTFQTQAKHNKMQANELYESIDELRLELQTCSGWSEGQARERHNLMRKIETLNRSLETKNLSASALRLDISKLQKMVENGDAEVERVATEIKEASVQADAKREETMLEQQTKVALEKRLQELQLDMKKQTIIFTEAKRRSREEGASIIEMENHLHKLKTEMEVYLKEYEELFQETQRLTEQLESLMYLNENMEGENKAKRVDIALKEKTINSLKLEMLQKKKTKEVLLKKTSVVEKQRESCEQARDELQARITQITACEIPAVWREGEAHQKKIENLKRERAILKRKLGGSEKSAKLISELTMINQNRKKNLLNEVNCYAATVKLQREQLEVLVRDRERHEQEANVASRRYYMVCEQLKLQDALTSDLQRKIVEGNSRLKQQQNSHEAVCRDRNAHSKTLIQSREDIAEMKRRFKIMNHQIEQFKEEINTKDQSLVKEHFKRHTVDAEREILKNDLLKIQKQIFASEQIVKNQHAEIEKLIAIGQHADEERQRQHKEYCSILGEHKILSAQLIRRNDELADIYEKLKVNWSSLQRGELIYAESITEVQSLKGCIRKMCHERDAQMISIDDIRQHMCGLEKELLHERNKIRALQQELERPLNVHRWRVLESSNPQLFEIINKNRHLQKSIARAANNLIEREANIQEKERLYVELKSSRRHQPSKTAVEQLADYQNNLRAKKSQLHSMCVELSMYKQQVAEFRSEIGNLANELDCVKAQWIHACLQASK
jgi:hypothetical protein